MVVALGLLWMLRSGGLPIIPARDTLTDIRWWGVGLYVLIWLVVLFVRSIRWVLLLRPLGEVPVRRVLTVSFMGLAALVALPLRTGEAVRPALISRGSSISGWAAAGTVGAERVIDGLLLSLLLITGLQLAAPLTPLPNQIGELQVPVAMVPHAARAAVLVFATAFVVMAVFYWRRAWAHAVTHRILGVVSLRFATWTTDRLERLATGLQFLPNPGTTLRFVAVTVLYWLLNSAGIWFLLWTCGFQNVSAGQALVVLGVLALGILVPNAPGYFGTFQLSAYGALALYFPPETILGKGAAFVFLLYVVQIVATLVLGGVSFLAEQRGPRYAPAPPNHPSPVSPGDPS